MALIRGLAVSPNAGTDKCHAIELAIEAADDYADAMDATVVAVCDQPALFVWMGSGLCADHHSQLKHQRGWCLN
jgi:hypothetical protein